MHVHENHFTTKVDQQGVKGLYSHQPERKEVLATKGGNLQTLVGTIPTLSNSMRRWKKIEIGRKISQSMVRRLEKLKEINKNSGDKISSFYSNLLLPASLKQHQRILRHSFTCSSNFKNLIGSRVSNFFFGFPYISRDLSFTAEPSREIGKCGRKSSDDLASCEEEWPHNEE